MAGSEPEINIQFFFQFNSLFVSDLSIHSYTIVNLNLNAINVHIYINEKVVEIVLQIRNPIDNRKIVC